MKYYVSINNNSYSVATIKEVEDLIECYRNDYYSRVRVYDNQLDAEIFLKDIWTFEKNAEINMLKPEIGFRDLRTTDRKAHY
jgi:hypothetical protein